MLERDEAVETRSANEAQARWASRPIAERLAILKTARHRLAEKTEELVDAIPSNLARTRADTMAAEVLPLLAACKFLERNAARILKTKHFGRSGLPFWLSGVHSSIERVSLGRILIIGPSNYPLFLPGVQVLQALAAGNAAIWKPGNGGRNVAHIFAAVMEKAGLPPSLLEVTNESTEAATNAIQQGVDKIIFTGSSASGRKVLHAAAETTTPVVAELSGCDAVIVLPSANADRVVAALTFGMRLNGSATCMAPRRLMLVGAGHGSLLAKLQDAFAAMAPIQVSGTTHEQLSHLVEDAVAAGATIHGDARSASVKPLLILNARPNMQIAQADIFAPVLTVMQFQTIQEALAAEETCSFGLTASIFGDQQEARRIGAKLKVGTVLINDLIAPTADPRVPFGGRRSSGFGVTRGAEGLLETTASKTVLIRQGSNTRHYATTTQKHEELFSGAIQMEHAAGWRQRFQGLQRMVRAAKNIK